MEINEIIPGFAMGFTRSFISHPFEILKIRSQLNVVNPGSLFKGLHYSLISGGIEKGIQFGLYDFFRKNNNNVVASVKSSCLTTFVSIPYNFLIVNKSVLNDKFKFTYSNLSKTIPLEYTRAFIGSSVFLFTYNEMKNKNMPLWASAFTGTTAVWLITYPIDNVRNQIISNKFNFALTNLYKGIQYPILRSIPASIAGMYVYEHTKNYVINYI